MKKTLLIGLLLLTEISCGQNNKWIELERTIKKSFKTCEPCLDEFSERKIEYLFQVLKEDFNTNIFDRLYFNKQISFSFCQNKYKNEGYMDCIYITKFSTDNVKDTEEIYEWLMKIPQTTIHYKPPQFWKWIMRDNSIYMLYSNVYDMESYEFEEVKKIMYTIL